MLQCVIDELNNIKGTRFESYSKKTKIENVNEKDNSFEIVIDKVDTIRIKNKLILFDKILVNGREMNIILYGEDGFNMEAVRIDLTNRFIQIYDTPHNNIVEFIEVDLKPDQIVDPEDVDMRDYPKVDFSVTDCDRLPTHKEIIFTVRMNPIDCFDYKVRTFASKKDGMENMLGQIQYHESIMRDIFKKFFKIKKIVFQDDYDSLKSSVVYDIIEHHYSEDNFAIREEGAPEEGTILVPYTALLGSFIEYKDDEEN